MAVSLVSVLEYPFSIIQDTPYIENMIRGLIVSALVAPFLFWVVALILLQNAKLARRFRRELRRANRNARALAEKNDELETAKLRLAEIANSDYLTGLANRRQFEKAFLRAFTDAKGGQDGFMLCLLDLNAFKAVNDTHGHDAGDAILRHTSVRIRKAMSEHEGLAARLGGDEFAVLLWGVKDKAEVEHFSKLLSATIAEPQGYRGEILEVTTTISCSIYNDTYVSAPEMYIATDRKLIAHKRTLPDRRTSTTPHKIAI